MKWEPDIENGKCEKNNRQNDCRVNKEFFHTSFGIISTKITPKSTPETRASILKKDREGKQNGDHGLHDKETSHKIDKK